MFLFSLLKCEFLVAEDFYVSKASDINYLGIGPLLHFTQTSQIHCVKRLSSSICPSPLLCLSS